MGAVLGIGSALIGASSASKAAKSQQQASANQLALAEETRDLTRADNAPFLQSGQNALAALQYEYGLADKPTFGATPLTVTEETINVPGVFKSTHERTGDPVYSTEPTTRTNYNVNGLTFDTRDAANEYAIANGTGGTEYQGFTKTPGYDYRLQEGVNALDMSAAARGGLFSGATLKAQTQFGQDYASGEYNNYLSRLSGLASNGQNAANSQAASNQFYSQQAGNAYAAAGNAQSAGAIATGNALQNGLQNMAGWYGYQNAQPANNNAGPFSTPWAAGGFWG